MPAARLLQLASGALPGHPSGAAAGPGAGRPRPDALVPPSADGPRSSAPARPAPTPGRRPRPSLLVAVDGDGSSHAALVWTLREAARREATVVAVSVCDATDADDPAPGLPAAAHGTRLAELDARVRAATAEAGVHPRVRTAVLDAQVFEAVAGAARGADLVVVDAHGKTLLRPAVARPPGRRFARPA